MEGFVVAISGSPYLNALAIVVTLATAIGFFWSNRAGIWRLLEAIWRFTLGRFVGSRSDTDRHTTMAIRYDRYLIAVLARHFAVAAIAVLLWWVTRGVLTSSSKTMIASLNALELALVILLNVCAFVAISRLNDAVVICRNIIDAHDSLEDKRGSKKGPDQLPDDSSDSDA